MTHLTIKADMNAAAARHAPCSTGRTAPRTALPAQPRLRGATARRPAGRSLLRVAAEGGSLDASYGTGAGSGRSGAAQLREGPAEMTGTALIPLDAAAAPSDGGAALQEAADYMRGELRRMFATGAITRQRYAANVRFQDPVVRLRGRDAYIANVQLLNMLFNIDFEVLRLETREPDHIDVRWSMVLKPKFVPWRPSLTLTGTSDYTVNTATGQITSHVDTWDAISDNSYLSLEGLALVIRSLTNVQQTPSLETPKYTVLRRTAEYEIRRYDPYMVAEVDMPQDAGPAAGEGFNDLAGYIFGGNNRNASMEMTTPVYSTAGQSAAPSRMQFVMEDRYGRDVSTLPTPNNARVERRLEESKTVASLQFPGLPLDWEVRDAERRLRGALLLDGLQPDDGYFLARYNEPFVLPALRRNEVLIRMPEGFEP